MEPEISRSWAQTSPPSNDDGQEMLDSLEAECTRRQRSRRQRAFARARRWVMALRGTGVAGPVSMSWSDPDQADVYRVDIEVRLGTAFA
jgi:hypothetical protein